jgi:hypothetical protein
MWGRSARRSGIAEIMVLRAHFGACMSMNIETGPQIFTQKGPPCYAAVGAADDRRSGRLAPRHRGSLLGKVDRAQLRVADLAFVARFQRDERFFGGERRRRAIRRARRPAMGRSSTVRVCPTAQLRGRTTQLFARRSRDLMPVKIGRDENAHICRGRCHHRVFCRRRMLKREQGRSRSAGAQG